MWGLQEIFDAALDRQIDKLKGDLVRKKFKKYGIALTKTQISAILKSADGTYNLELSDSQHRAVRRATGDKLPDNITIDFTDDDVQEITSKFSPIFEKLIPTIVDKSANTMLREMKKSITSELRKVQKLEAGFEGRLVRRWKRPLQLFEMYLTIVKQAGAEFNSRYRPQAAKDKDFVFDVVIRLHARGCQIASEVLNLLKSGFADGAHARWRSLHEVAAVALFIQKHGNDVAERYLLHDVVESYRAATQYQKYCRAIGYKPFSKAKMNRFRRDYDFALQRFGRSFGSPNGWAAVALCNQSPTFADLEKNVGLDNFRPYYKMASHNVHANPKGITHKLGLLPSAGDALLAGPSDVGLADPLHGTAISLMQITTTFMVMKPIIDFLTLSAVLTKLQREIGEESLRSQNSIQDHYEKVIQRTDTQI